MDHLHVEIDEAARHDVEHQLQRLHATGRYFTDWVESDGPLSAYLLDHFFPHAQPARYHAANLTLDAQAEHVTLALRPVIESPDGLPLPPGFSLAMIGTWPRRVAHPVLRIRRLHEMADTPSRPFERQVEAVVFQHEARAAARQRPQPGSNLLSGALAAELPLISSQTRERLGEWRDFLAWKRRLVNARSIGVRYLALDWQEPAPAEPRLRLQVQAPDAATLAQVRSSLQREELVLLPLEASSDAWTLQPADTGASRGKRRPPVRVGRLQPGRDEPRPVPAQGTPGAEDARPAGVQAEWIIALDDEDLDALQRPPRSGEASPQAQDELREKRIASWPRTGFLSISQAGDLGLIARHERTLKELAEQGGCAPYLSSWLFDVAQARPGPSPSPSASRPGTSSSTPLNPAQREAVSKMLTAPDLFLLQGPPGTGKTTVIAEAITRFVARGETVLLSSQAHTAVDNALGRLAGSTAVRAIRLGREDRITDEGRDFVGARSLARYYRALSEHSRERLARWDGPRQEHERLVHWLERADLLDHDGARLARQLDAQVQQVRSLAQDLERVRALLQAERQARADAAEREHALAALQAELLAPGRSGRPAVLDAAVQPQAEAFAQAMLATARAGARLSVRADEWRDLPSQRAALLWLLLADLARLTRAGAELHQQAVRLQAGSDTPDALDPQTRQRLQALEAEIEALQEQLDDSDEPELIARLRQCRRERTQLREGQGRGDLASAGPAEVFADPAPWSPPGPDRRDFGQRLQQALAPILQALSSASAAQARLLAQVQAQQQALAATRPAGEPDEQPLRLAEQAWRGACQAETALRLRQIELHERIAPLLDEAPMGRRPLGDDEAAPDDLAALQTERLRHREGCDALARRLAHERQQRELWTPLHQAWQQDLDAQVRAADLPGGCPDWEHLQAEWPGLCNVVALTCNENPRTLEEAGHTAFDVALIDEVSKATPLEMLMPMMRSRRSVLVGDHRQLPPLFQEGQEAVDFQTAADEAEDGTQAEASALTPDNLRRFERMVTASLFKEHFEQADPSLRERLTVQFRMHPQIMALVNSFYENQLACGLTDPDTQRAHGLTITGANDEPLIQPDEHVLWIDTSHGTDGQPAREDLDNGGRPLRTNRLEARLIAQLLQRLDQAAVQAGHDARRPLTVGIVSFYAAQLRCIRQQIDAVRPPSGWQAIAVDLNTVIRYQGQERDVVLVSLVRNDGRGPEVRRSRRANVARYEFINVAMSRARSLLVVLGACAMLESREVELPHMDRPGRQVRRIYQEMFRHLRMTDALVPARAVLRAEAPASRLSARPSSRSRTGLTGDRS